jgi:hypothetical protein
MIAGHHVISIEEDGQITIQKLEAQEDEDYGEEQEEQRLVQVSASFPPWYHRLASTLLGFLHTGTVTCYFICHCLNRNSCIKILERNMFLFIERLISEKGQKSPAQRLYMITDLDCETEELTCFLDNFL